MSVYYPSTHYVSGIHTFSTLGDGSFANLEGLNQRSQHPLLRCQQSNVSITGFMNVSEHLTVAKTIYASNLQILGDFVTLNTVTSNTEQMVIENAGTGPALKVTQTGNNSVAEFYDKESGVALFVGNGANVGIGTTVPMAALDVNGDIKLSGIFINDKFPNYIPLNYDNPTLGNGYMPKVPTGLANATNDGGILKLFFVVDTPITIPASPKSKQKWDGFVQPYCGATGQTNVWLEIKSGGTLIYKGFTRQWHPTATNQPITTPIQQITTLSPGNYTYTIYVSRADNANVMTDQNCCWFIALQTF